MASILKIGLAVLDDRGRLLVVRKRGTVTWILAGGKPEAEEDDVDCLVREIAEELGTTMSRPPTYVGSFGAPAADRPGDVVMLRAYEGVLSDEPRACSEIEEIRWIDMDAPDVPIAQSIANSLIPALRNRT